MKLKYYLRGVGIGVVVTTLILTIAFNIRRQDTPDTPTQSQTSNLDNILNSTAATESSEQKSTEKSTEVSTESSTEVSTENLSESTAEASQESSTQAPAQEMERVDIVVNLSGLTSSEQVSELLAVMGLVGDKNEFNSYLVSNGYAEIIWPQTYTITKGSDYETIARIICGK